MHHFSERLTSCRNLFSSSLLLKSSIVEGFSPHIVTRVNDFHSSELLKFGALPGVSRPSSSRVMSMGISQSSMSSVGRMYLQPERVGERREGEEGERGWRKRGCVVWGRGRCI